MLQFKDVHGLGVAGSAEELGIHAEHQGADVHIPEAKQRQDRSVHGMLFKEQLGFAHRGQELPFSRSIPEGMALLHISEGACRSAATAHPRH